METRKQLIEHIMANINALKHAMHHKVMRQDMHNITHSQWFALSIINEHQNMSITEIAKMLGITSSAATQLVDGLAETGYVLRKTNAKDRRSLHLNLSPKAKKSITMMKKHYAKTMEKLFGALGNDELETYLHLHKKILANIKSH